MSVYLSLFILIGGTTCNYGAGERAGYQATKVEGDYDQSQALLQRSSEHEALPWPLTCLRDTG